MVNLTDHNHPDEYWIEIREVFYDTLGKPLGHTTATIGGENTQELRSYLQWGLEALDKPILTFGDNNDHITRNN
jgi:hypothetical protein